MISEITAVFFSHHSNGAAPEGAALKTATVSPWLFRNNE